jgi:hypothetical protein
LWFEKSGVYGKFAALLSQFPDYLLCVKTSLAFLKILPWQSRLYSRWIFAMSVKNL